MPITLTVRGLGNVPSFKNKKRSILRKDTGQMMPVTETKTKHWMRQCIASFELQLRYGSATTDDVTGTAARPQSSIASLPHDDCWQAIPVLIVTSEKCLPGNEGATITVTPI